ncbi:MAG TPA: WG repeat-containing protein [Bacteroidia bacterium]|nr:WG repeat-containing protein [Bacteroidia bacterium]
MTIISFLFGNKKPKPKTDNEIFEEILNDPRVNSKGVGEREGIKYFQVMKNGKTGFRDLDGDIVIEPKFDAAEMFSEGFSAVQVGKKWGLIDETGKYIIEPKYDYLGSVNNGLAAYSLGDKYGFLNTEGTETIRPQFAWVGEFSEMLCVVRNSKGKYGYIDSSGKLIIECQFEYAMPFENGIAKIQLNNLWGKIDRTGKIIEPPTHKYAYE